MLDKQNVIVESLESPSGNRGLTEQVCHEVYVKMVDYLRLTQSKNTYNRFTDYHYLNIPVSNSTEPIRGIDYIQPIVAPGIDYATAVITKCLMPNGKINFEFERFSEADGDQARQATEMVKYMLNSKNDSYQFVRDWAQDALLHKCGVVMVSPVREQITQYKEVEGTKDNLRSFEIMATEKGLIAKRQQMRRIDVDLQGVAQETMMPDETGQPTEPSFWFFGKNIALSAMVAYVGFQLSQANGIPYTLILLVFLIVVYTMIMNKTTFGRHIYAIGGNLHAATLSGINVRRVNFWLFVNMGALAAISGILIAARMNSAVPKAGDGFELDAISSVFIGGAAVQGGVGTVVGSMVGGLIQGVLGNGMNLNSVGIDAQMTIKGMVLLLAVAFDVWSKRRGK